MTHQKRDALSTTSKLYLAPSQLSDMVFAAIYRDTRGTPLSDKDRLNHFPASPLVTITLVFSGQLFLVPSGQSWQNLGDTPPLPKISVIGPSDAPTTSWSPSSIEAVAVAIYPDAWMQMGGDHSFSKIPPKLMAVIKRIEQHPNMTSAWPAFCKALSELWASSRKNPNSSITTLSDWVRSVMVHASMSGKGQSFRAFQRRLKRYSGHTKRSLDFYSNMENLHRIAHRNDINSPAEIATQAGFADQSHMGRTLRRATGFSPVDLNQSIETEEAFWCYRLLGERF